MPLNGTFAAFTCEVDDVTVSIAFAVPLADGVNVTSSVQLPPFSSVAPQVVAPAAKLAAEVPEIWKPTSLIAAPPVFETLSVNGELVAFTAWLLKFRLVGLTENTGGSSPVPDSPTVCVLSMSATVSFPVCTPAAVGRNVTLMAHVALAASCVVQLLLSTNAPLTVTAIPVSGLPPLFVRVTVWTADVTPITVPGKVSDAGSSVSVGGAVPFPESCTVCVPARSTMVSTPVAAPGSDGVNFTVIWQSVFGARAVVPQPLLARTNGPVTCTLVIETGTPPAFSAVICRAAEIVPLSISPKSIVVGCRLTFGAATPVPAKSIVILPLLMLP